MKSFHNWRGLNAVWFALLLFSAVVTAQMNFDPIENVGVKIEQVPATIPNGGAGNIEVTVQLPPMTHITSREYEFFFVEFEEVQGVTWGLASFPSGIDYRGEEVYQGDVKVSLAFQIADTYKPGDEINFSGLVGYQICTETEPEYCTPPIEREISGLITVGEGKATASIGADDGEKLSLEQRAMSALESGSILALLWVFLGGVALSFTPCVYPVIPITIAYIGGRSSGSKFKGFMLSLVFVLGLALVYSALGLFAAATGGVFGLSTQSPFVVGFVTLVFLVMGVGMLGAFDISLPSSMQTKMTSHKRGGFVGALFVGGTTGLIAAPCVGPVLIALLSWISATGNLWAGFIYMFVFAAGLGAIFVVIGTFAGALTALPKAGEWMDSVKVVFGVIMIAAAFYFGRSMVPDVLFTILVGLGLLMLSGLLGLFTKLEEFASLGAKMAKGLAVFVAVAGVSYTFFGFAQMKGFNLSGGGAMLNGSIGGGGKSVVVASKGHDVTVQWIKDDEKAAFERAKAEGKPVMIDFWAEWCAACKELDHKTFSQKHVYDYINSNFVPLKVDGTKITADIKEIWGRYSVKGLPTVLFITPDGEEVGRFEAFRTAEQVMTILENVPK